MERYSFNEMTEELLAEILQIYNYYVLHTTATFHAKALTPEEMRDIVFFESDKYKTFVICEQDRVLGYVLITRHKNREAYDKTAEVTIYLRQGCTGKGIGSRAIQYIEAYARQQGFHVLVATICGENGESIRLMERNGFSKCAHYREVGEKFGQLLDIVAYQKIIS